MEQEDWKLTIENEVTTVGKRPLVCFLIKRKYGHGHDREYLQTALTFLPFQRSGEVLQYQTRAIHYSSRFPPWKGTIVDTNAPCSFN
jgi:hypothetical protein